MKKVDGPSEKELDIVGNEGESVSNINREEAKYSGGKKAGLIPARRSTGNASKVRHLLWLITFSGLHWSCTCVCCHQEQVPDPAGVYLYHLPGCGPVFFNHWFSLLSYYYAIWLAPNDTKFSKYLSKYLRFRLQILHVHCSHSSYPEETVSQYFLFRA